MRFWIVLLCLLLLRPAFAQELLTERISLQYTTPTEITTLLKKTRHYNDGPSKTNSKKPGKVVEAMPDGIRSIIPNPKTNTLSIKGTRAGIDTLKGLIALLDVPKHSVKVKVSLIEVQFAADGTKSEKVILSPTLRTTENKQATITIPLPNRRSCTMGVTPRLNEDGSMILVTLLSVMWENNSRDSLTRPMKMKPGELKRIAGVTDTIDPKTRGTIGGGYLPEKWTGSFTGYYLDATPTVEPFTAP